MHEAQLSTEQKKKKKINSTTIPIQRTVRSVEIKGGVISGWFVWDGGQWLICVNSNGGWYDLGLWLLVCWYWVDLGY